MDAYGWQNILFYPGGKHLPRGTMQENQPPTGIPSLLYSTCDKKSQLNVHLLAYQSLQPQPTVFIRSHKCYITSARQSPWHPSELHSLEKTMRCGCKVQKNLTSWLFSHTYCIVPNILFHSILCVFYEFHILHTDRNQISIFPFWLFREPVTVQVWSSVSTCFHMTNIPLRSHDETWASSI